VRMCGRIEAMAELSCMPRVIRDDGGRSFPLRRVIEDGPGTRLSNTATKSLPILP
jgi:hypothetical protein